MAVIVIVTLTTHSAGFFVSLGGLLPSLPHLPAPEAAGRPHRTAGIPV